VKQDGGTPQFREDFWSDEILLNPYPTYDLLRDLGSAVWLTKNSAWALTTYDAVKSALLNPTIFSSASGCMMNEPMNQATQGIMLCSDDPTHLEMRRLFTKPLQPKALKALRSRLERLAADQIEALLAKGTFDAVSELAHFLPLTVVTELVGLDEEGRSNMLEWAAGIFNAFGPLPNDRTLSGLQLTETVVEYVLKKVDRRTMIPGGWGEALFIAADNGEISEDTARMMLIDYISPALDTTINATSAAIELFAANPMQWNLVRNDPSIIPHAINEIVRIESPIRAFSRLVTKNVQVGSSTLEAGSRALMLYGCANRDPAKYPDPARFDVLRKPNDHLGFGFGTHVCAGMHLAKLEISVLLEALVRRVAAFKTANPVRRPHNTLRGLTSLDAELVPRIDS